MSESPQYSIGEEIGNAVSHGIGSMLALIGYGYMLALSVRFGTALSICCCSIYCLTLFFMFICSTCYHALPYPNAKRVLRILDHCAIPLLIAGSYTPFLLITFGGKIGLVSFSVIWTAAIIGVLLNAIDLKRFAKLSLFLYIIMGWAVVFTLRTLVLSLPHNGLILMAIGGLFYTIGILFYIRKGTSFMHFIWHLFVLIGAILHYYCILLYVLPHSFVM